MPAKIPTQFELIPSAISWVDRRGVAPHGYFRQSLAVATEIGHAKGMMDAHHKLAVLHFTRKKYALRRDGWGLGGGGTSPPPCRAAHTCPAERIPFPCGGFGWGMR